MNLCAYILYLFFTEEKVLILFIALKEVEAENLDLDNSRKSNKMNKLYSMQYYCYLTFNDLKVNIL